MKLLCDAMLGRLSKRLRILGFDTEYSAYISDEELIESDRIVITRDRELHRKRSRLGKYTILIVSYGIVNELSEALCKLGVRHIKRNPIRCPVCNGILEPIAKEEVKDLIPENVYKRRNVFWRCSKCGKIYRIGKHRLDMLEKIEEVRRKLEGCEVKKYLIE